MESVAMGEGSSVTTPRNLSLANSMPQPEHLAGSLVRGKVARSGGHGLEGAGQVALEVALHAFLHHDAAYAVNKARVPAKLHAVRCETLHL